MFPRRFFAADFFAPRFFPQSEGEVAVMRRQQEPGVWGYVSRTGAWGY